MRSQPVVKEARYPRLARISKVSLFVIPLWLTLAGGVVILLQGNILGIVSIVGGIALIVGFRTRAIRLFFEAESRSPSLPARMLSAHVLVLLLSALPATVYLSELPLYMMSADSQRVFIFAGGTAMLSAGALIACLIALRRDRADAAGR